MVQDQMLGQVRGFYPGLNVIIDQLDPFIAVPRENAKSGSNASKPSTDVGGFFCSYSHYSFCF